MGNWKGFGKKNNTSKQQVENYIDLWKFLKISLELHLEIHLQIYVILGNFR